MENLENLETENLLKKIFLATMIAIFMIFFGAAFDWPQNEAKSDDFFSDFGQFRGGTICSSLVFSNTEEVKASETGEILLIFTDDSQFFPSTLGNAIILQHQDEIQTVYANLDCETFSTEIFESKTIEQGKILAQSTSSAWQEEKSALEFKVLDTKKKIVINPRVLMPRLGKERELNIRSVSAIGKNKKEIKFATQKNLEAGVYKIYSERQKNSMPFKTTIYVNGAASDSISYDVLLCDKNRLCVAGRKNYEFCDVYPNEKNRLLGEVLLPRGKIQLRIVLEDILGNSIFASYFLDVK